MLDAVELVVLDDSHEDDRDETCSLLSGLTDHTKEEQRLHLTSSASPYGKTLLSMKLLADERRRQSLWKVLPFVLCSMIGLVGLFSMVRSRSNVRKTSRGAGDEITPFFNATRATPDPNHKEPKNHTSDAASINIIVQMSGEMGNHLSKLASGIGVGLYLRELHGLESNLLLRHQDRTEKWKPAVASLQSCFPFAKPLNFSEAQTYDPSRAILPYYDGINDTNETSIIAAVKKIAQDAQRNQSSTITVYSNHLTLLDAYMDRYYEVYREYFAMNQTCCATLPDDDEIVLHMRLFTKEMPRKGVQKGYEEVSPKDLVEQALKPYEKNSNKKIAILSRYSNHVYEYAKAVGDAGWDVRVIANQTATQDFCFLMHSRTMIGSVRSTFFFWAAVLSDTAEKVVAYSIDSPAKRAWAKEHNTTVLESYPFRNPTIQDKFEFPLYVAST